MGDKLLFLRRVDKLEYDVLEEDEKRKARELELELEKARQMRGRPAV